MYKKLISSEMQLRKKKSFNYVTWLITTDNQQSCRISPQVAFFFLYTANKLLFVEDVCLSWKILSCCHDESRSKSENQKRFCEAKKKGRHRLSYSSGSWGNSQKSRCLCPPGLLLLSFGDLSCFKQQGDLRQEEHYGKLTQSL